MAKKIDLPKTEFETRMIGVIKLHDNLWRPVEFVDGKMTMFDGMEKPAAVGVMQEKLKSLFT